MKTYPENREQAEKLLKAVYPGDQYHKLLEQYKQYPVQKPISWVKALFMIVVRD